MAPFSGDWGRLDVLAEVTSVALFAIDADGGVVTWNRGAERVFGYAEADVRGHSFAALAAPHMRESLARVDARLRNGERFDRLSMEIQRKDGMLVPIALSFSPWVDDDEHFVGALGVAQDLTEIRLAQAALAEVEERFREWEALAHVGRWMWDVGSDAVQWSDELHRLHGVEPQDFDGTLVAHLAAAHVDDRQRLHDSMLAAVASGQGFAVEYRVEIDGGVRWLEMRAEPAVGSSGEVVGLRGISHEVTINVARR